MSEMKTKEWMQRALTLAERGQGHTSPNPMVGTVIVRSGRVIGEGYHRILGGPHAEANALKKAGKAAKGAHLIVTLEPCCHLGRTPRCTDAIIQSGIKQVTVATKDPNPKVNGKGIARLRRAGIKVEVGLLTAEAKELNRFYFKHTLTGLPWVTLKAAMTLDGFIAAGQGKQKWISCRESRELVHSWRHNHDAVLVGIETVLEDNPRLNCRAKSKTAHPLKIILDSRLRLPSKAKLINGAPTLLFTTSKGVGRKALELEKRGVEIISTKALKGKPDPRRVLQELGRRGVNSVLLEGGGGLFSSFLEHNLIDHFNFFISGKILGPARRSGKAQNTPVFSGLHFPSLEKAFTLEGLSAIQSGADWLLQAYPKR